MKNVAPAQPHIGYIDGLRGIAVLGVVVAHIALHARLTGPLAHIALEGAHGVDLFFVISGFCLAYPTLRKFRAGGSREFDLSSYMARRLVRICPPYYIATGVLLLAALLAVVAGRMPIIDIPSPLDLVKQVLFLDGRVELVNSSFWTLMVEFRWYFLFPICLAVWLRSPRAFVSIGIAAEVLYLFTRSRGVDFGTLPGFMLGIVAADLHAGARLSDATARRIKRLAPWLALIAVGVGIAVEPYATIPGFNGSDYLFAYQPTILAWQLAAGFAVVACGTTAWLRSVLLQRWLVATGVASYSIYLVHEPIVTAVLHKSAGLGGYAIAAVVSTAAGFVFWFAAERPFTTGSLRNPLTNAVTMPVRRLFALAGIPERLPLAVAAEETQVTRAPLPVSTLSTSAAGT